MREARGTRRREEDHEGSARDVHRDRDRGRLRETRRIRSSRRDGRLGGREVTSPGLLEKPR